MKKKMNLLAQAFLISIVSLSTITCSNSSLTNPKADNLEKWRIEKLPNLKDPHNVDLTVFNNKLYIAQSGGISSFDSQGKMTRLKTENININSMSTFNGNLYGGTKEGKIFKIDKQETITYLEKELRASISAMKEFGNYLYIGLSSGDLYQMDKKGNLTLVKIGPINVDKSKIEKMIVFKNYLYLIQNNLSIIKFLPSGEWVSLTKNDIKNVSVSQISLSIFNDELYIGIHSSSTKSLISKLDQQNNSLLSVLDIKVPLTSLTTFNDELYISLHDKYLWKMDKQNKISKVDINPIAIEYLTNLCIFNDELYITYDLYGFSKLTNK